MKGRVCVRHRERQVRRPRGGLVALVWRGDEGQLLPFTLVRKNWVSTEGCQRSHGSEAQSSGAHQHKRSTGCGLRLLPSPREYLLSITQDPRSRLGAGRHHHELECLLPSTPVTTLCPKLQAQALKTESARQIFVDRDNKNNSIC